MRQGEVTQRVVLSAKREGSHKSIYGIAAPANTNGGLATMILFSLFFIAACTKERRDQPSNPVTSPSGASTLSSLQSDVFALSCATSGCHDNRATPAGSLNMSSAAQTHSHLVNRNSIQATALKLVQPNNPGASYFVNKLNGTHLSVGGSGVQMPQYAAALSTPDMDRIVNWINNGAPLD